MNPDTGSTRARDMTADSQTPASAAPVRRLASTFAAAITVPEIAGEHCVHARIETARCRACADACPRNAWIVDDEQVGIDTEACDGCDLCVPACPEGAILGNRSRAPEIRIWNDRPAAFRACEHVGISATTDVIPCLHAIGVADVLRLYRRGVRDWIASAAPCESCPRGPKPRFEDAIRRVQALLASRDLPSLTLTVLEPQDWSASVDRAAPYVERTALSRRGFFRQALLAVDTAVESAAADASASWTPATAWLPDIGSERVQLYQPVIDPQRCNGCDACVRLCAHQAIALERSPDGVQYRLDGRRCTGCGVCRDVCDQGAASVIALQPQATATVALVEQRCLACGTIDHEPAARSSRDGFCRICARTQRTRLLYQTLD